MQKFRTKQIIPLVTAAIALVYIYLGLTKFGFWQEPKGPASGFVPVIIAVLLVLVSILAFVQSLKEQEADYPKENWLVVLGCLGIIGATFVIGLIPSLFVYMILWLKGLEKCSWASTIKVTAVIMAIVIGVFILWLEVPFPQGMIVEAILS